MAILTRSKARAALQTKSQPNQEQQQQQKSGSKQKQRHTGRQTSMQNHQQRVQLPPDPERQSHGSLVPRRASSWPLGNSEREAETLERISHSTRPQPSSTTDIGRPRPRLLDPLRALLGQRHTFASILATATLLILAIAHWTVRTYPSSFQIASQCTPLPPWAYGTLAYPDHESVLWLPSMGHPRSGTWDYHINSTQNGIGWVSRDDAKRRITSSSVRSHFKSLIRLFHPDKARKYCITESIARLVTERLYESRKVLESALPGGPDQSWKRASMQDRRSWAAAHFSWQNVFQQMASGSDPYKSSAYPASPNLLCRFACVSTRLCRWTSCGPSGGKSSSGKSRYYGNEADKDDAWQEDVYENWMSDRSARGQSSPDFAFQDAT